MFKENISLKLISLLLAMFIWLQSTLVSEHKAVMYLPVALVNIPENLSFDNLPQKVPFVLKGSGLDLIRLKLHKTRIELDAKKFKPGTSTLDLTDYNINIPQNLSIELIGPAEDQELMVQSDVFHRKSVPVELVFNDPATKTQFESFEHRYFPDKVQLFGPKSKLQKINSISTTKITRAMLSQKEFRVDLDPLDEDISVSDMSIKVNIIDEASITKILYNTPITASKSIIPSSVTVIVKGTVSSIQALRPEQVKASIEEKASPDGSYKVLVTVPESLILMDITPATVYSNE